MNLHQNQLYFNALASSTASYTHLSVESIKRDYYIVLLLYNLMKSEYGNLCVFKGGTSLSKCYPGSINRFSEDIDLTYIPLEPLSNRAFDKNLKTIEKIITQDFSIDKISNERNNRNKSSLVYFKDNYTLLNRIKLEIGSSIKPEPIEKRKMKTYIQEYLEYQQMYVVIKEFHLEEFEINTLCIERTFLDKVMAVKRHAICGTLPAKARHIYDIYMLYNHPLIQLFLQNKSYLKEILQLTKATDSYYLQKRNIPDYYDPTGPYDFEKWKIYFNEEVRYSYENLHQTILYSHQKQYLDDAIQVLEKLNLLFKEIGE